MPRKDNDAFGFLAANLSAGLVAGLDLNSFAMVHGLIH
jgi:hypothetical protein